MALGRLGVLRVMGDGPTVATTTAKAFPLAIFNKAAMGKILWLCISLKDFVGQILAAAGRAAVVIGRVIDPVLQEAVTVVTLPS